MSDNLTNLYNNYSAALLSLTMYQALHATAIEHYNQAPMGRPSDVVLEYHRLRDMAKDLENRVRASTPIKV